MANVLTERRTYTTGITVGISAWLLGHIVNKFGLVDILNIGGQKVTTGALSANIGTAASELGTANALGVKAMALLTSIPGGLFTQTSIIALITVIIGSTLIVMAGRTIYGWIKVPKSEKWKLAAELFYGAVIATIIIAGIGGVGVSAVTTLAIYYLIIATATKLLSNMKWYSKLIR